MTTRVYVGRLSREARQRDIEKLFKGYGEIREVNLKNGFGFVEFRDHKDAEDVVYDFHGKEFLGERLIVELAKGDRARRERVDRYERRRDDRYGPSSRTQYRLIVEGIAPGTSWQDLKDFMRRAGEVTFADVMKDREGEGVVEFSSYDDMKKAIKKLNGEDLKGSRVTLRDQKRDRRSTSRSRSRTPPPRRRSGTSSRSRSRSHSHSPRRNRRSRSRSPRDRNRDRHSRRKRERRDRTRSRSPSHNHSDVEDDDKTRKHSRRSGSEEHVAQGLPRSKSPIRDDRDDEKRDRKERSPGRRNSGRSSHRNRSPSPRGSKSRSVSPIDDRVPSRSSANKEDEDMEVF